MVTLSSFTIFSDDYIGIKDIKFGMSSDEVLQTIVKHEEFYNTEGELSKKDIKKRKKEFSEGISDRESFRQKHKQTKSILSASDLTYNKYNESMKYFKGFDYMGQFWDPTLYFIDDKLYEIRLGGNYTDELPDIIQHFKEKYQMQDLQTTYSHDLWGVKEVKAVYINEATKNTLTIRHDAFEENFTKLRKEWNFIYLYAYLSFHSDIPELIEYNKQKEQEELKKTLQKLATEEERKQKIYDEL